MNLSEPDIKGMLNDLMLEIDCGALRYSQDFIKDLNKFYREKGFLSEKQEKALRKIYTGHME